MNRNGKKWWIYGNLTDKSVIYRFIGMANRFSRQATEPRPLRGEKDGASPKISAFQRVHLSENFFLPFT